MAKAKGGKGLEVDRGLGPLVRLVSKDKARPNLMGVDVRPGKGGDRYTATDGHRMLTVVAKPGHAKAAEDFSECVVGAEDWKTGLAHVATDKESRDAHPSVTLRVVDDGVAIENRGGDSRMVTVEGELVSGTFPEVGESMPDYAAELDATGLNKKGAAAYAVQVNPSLLAGLLKVMGDLSEAPVLLHVPLNSHLPVKVVGRFGDGEMVGIVMPIAAPGD